MEKTEERFDDLEKDITEIKTSIRWARAGVVLLIPFILTGIGGIIMMYSGQNQFQKVIDKHLEHHKRIYEPMIQTNRENILVMKSEKVNTDEKLKTLSKRIDGNNHAVNDLERLKLGRKTGRRYR